MTEILADIRQAPEGKYETVNDIYVLDEDKHLAGVFSLDGGKQLGVGLFDKNFAVVHGMAVL